MFSKLFPLLLILLVTESKAQTVDELFNTFSVTCSTYKNDIFSDNVCEKTITELSTLESKISESLFFNKTLTAQEKTKLKDLKIEVVSVSHFISYQQACGSEYFTHTELQTACKALNATFEEVFIDKYCMKIYRTQLGEYVNYLVENNSNDHKKLNYKVKRIPYGVGAGESQIQAKGIKELYNNKTEKDIKTIDIVFLNCL